MSHAAISWATHAEQSGTMDASHRLVLVILASHADPEGRGAWPSAQTISDRLGIDKRSVRRSLKWLQEHDVIRRGDQAAVHHVPEGKRPVVWDLAMPADGVTRPSPLTRPSRVTSTTSRGDETVRGGVTRPSPKPTTRTTTEPTPQTPHPGTTRPRSLRDDTCEHGDPGGAELHPKSHEPRCALCRAQFRAQRAAAS
ncbi:helix-turn-helix domain-containing protein [Ornithinimicrobium sp. CNJ-824]|uniref:helix-turn-helix domain-containing protein n=1 Tax=Ornithinimicrobium sp. CNJ-824 TaxID=1904966 RepID=UPI00096AA696|nr:helix-turn-helix domain-containing protein [Ornithinimicrobium sp. CNJ-824]